MKKSIKYAWKWDLKSNILPRVVILSVYLLENFFPWRNFWSGLLQLRTELIEHLCNVKVRTEEGVKEIRDFKIMGNVEN